MRQAKELGGGGQRGPRSRFLATMSHEIRTPMKRDPRLHPSPANHPGHRRSRASTFDLDRAGGRDLLVIINDVHRLFRRSTPGRLELEEGSLPASPT